MTPHSITTPQFLETIRYADGQLHLLDLHNDRLRATQREVFGQATTRLDATLFSIPAHLTGSTVKCRVIYDREITEIQYEPYTPRPLTRLRLVTDESIDYHLKYLDRRALAYPDIIRRPDEGLIIVKNGLITDSTYANLLFHAGEKAYTPSTPLLPGVMRRHLLDTGQIIPITLRPADILPGNSLGITHVSYINALLPPGILPTIPVTEISFDTNLFYG